MQNFRDIVQKVSTFHSSIAEKLVGGVLECAVCHRCTTPSKEDLASYLANGWPRCCEEQMSWGSKKEGKNAEVR